MMKESDLRTALLISGSGSTAEAILRARRKGELDGIHLVAVVASRADAGGIKKAEALGIPTYCIERQNYSSHEEFGNDLLTLLRDTLHVDLVSQNGWLPLTPPRVIHAFADRIINQHPGPLDPGRAIDFGGVGMYGARVTGARLAYTWASQEGFWTEATIHHVTEEFDKGKLIGVSSLPIPELGYTATVANLQENPARLIEATRDVQASLLPLEHALVVHTLRTIGQMRSIPSYIRETQLVPDQFVSIARDAKQVAVKLFPKG